MTDEQLKKHQEDFKLWNRAINYGLSKKLEGKMTELERLKHMLEVAIMVKLPPYQIVEMEDEILQLENKEKVNERQKEIVD